MGPAGEACSRGRPADIGAPAFMRIDFVRKSIVGPKRTSPILFIEKGESQLLLQGTELDYAWTMALDQATGQLAATLVDREGARASRRDCAGASRLRDQLARR